MGKNSAKVMPLQASDLAELAGIVRDADRDEIEAASGLGLEAALSLLIPGSIKASKFVHDGKLLAVLGDAQHDDDTGVPWMITTKHVNDYPREFLRACRPAADDMASRHRQLINYVDARNVTAVRWLRWLGFAIGYAVPYGAKGLPFRQFKKDCNNH